MFDYVIMQMNGHVLRTERDPLHFTAGPLAVTNILHTMYRTTVILKGCIMGFHGSGLVP